MSGVRESGGGVVRPTGGEPANREDSGGCDAEGADWTGVVATVGCDGGGGEDCKGRAD